MRICHVISMNDISEMGEIARIIYNECEGDHIFCNVHDNDMPCADIYLLHCFKNQKHFPKFMTWTPPDSESFVISLIHSSEPCMPNKYSDVVVTITKAWQERMYDLYGVNSILIYGALDLDKFKDVEIDYSKKAFGKITRPEPGKYHKDWNKIVEFMLNKYNDSKCVIVSNNYKKLDYLKHERMEFVEGVKINDYDSKIRNLQKMSIYTECHNDGGNAFIDTFCVATLEGMACGLPIVIYKGLQEPLAEVVGNAGIVCDTITDYMDALEMLLQDEKLRKYYGKKSKKRAQFFNKDKMISEWNSLFEDLAYVNSSN